MTPEEYRAKNPLGGPATMFLAIAERIQAGEDYATVLADYDVHVGLPTGMWINLHGDGKGFTRLADVCSAAKTPLNQRTPE